MAKVRARCPDAPFNLLVYGNLVHARGFNRFAKDAVAAGASTLLVPDIPLEECSELSEACRSAGLGIVQMVAPSTPPERIALLDAAANAFLYVTGHQGITGAETGPGGGVSPVKRVRAVARNRICLGFGLTSADGVRTAFRDGASIAVVGSHLARVIEKSVRNGQKRTVPDFIAAVEPLIAAEN